MLKSTLHRVTLPPLADRFSGPNRITRARYAIPYFCSCNPDSVIECLPVCTDAANPPKYEPVKQEDWDKIRRGVQYRRTKTDSVTGVETAA